jgi:UDP-glucuronate decarboxylase
MSSSAKRILVTGGAGLIGSHLCERLIAAGHEVVCIDNFFSGTDRNMRLLLEHPRFRHVRHDITQPFDETVDEIYNLACPAAPVHYQVAPVGVLKVTIHGAMNMLELAMRTGARVLQASTSEVYGDPTVRPQPESYWGNVNPIGPRSCYDEGKRAAEALFFAYHRQHGVRIKVARIFNTYGPRMHPNDGRVVSNFIMQSLYGKPITIYGAGDNSRTFTYVDDTVEGLLRLMAAPDDLTGPVNLGDPTEVTVRTLAQAIIELTGSHSEIAFLPSLVDDPQQRQADITLARTRLDWSPRTPLREGLSRTIAYFAELKR